MTETIPRAATEAAAAHDQLSGAAPHAAPETGRSGTGPGDLPLRRNRQFQTLWAGSAAARLGLTVADVAYPLAILAVTGSPAQAGLFAAVQAAGMIVAGLPAGHLVDRRSPRRVLIVAETCRAVVTAVVAAALATGWLTFPLLLAAAALLGIGQPTASAARLLLVRAAVPKGQLTRALTQDEVRINGADLVGPPVGGALYALRALAHAAPFVFTAASFVLSLASALMIKAGPGRPRGQRPMAGQAAGQGCWPASPRSGAIRCSAPRPC
jgi:MFS family permease